MRYMVLALLFVGVCQPAWVWADQPTKGYVEAASVRYGPAGGEAGVRVALYVDERMTKDVQGQLWGQGDWADVLPAASPVRKSFAGNAPRPALLVLRNEQGVTLDRRTLEVVLARVEQWPAGISPDRSLLLTLDYTAGAGSYGGLVTMVVGVVGGRLVDVSAADESAANGPILFSRTGKADWKFAPGSPLSVLAVSCERAENGDDAAGTGFELLLERYVYSNGRWSVSRRKATGYWEVGYPFPSLRRFP
ncbi:MAG: hypothetical protein QM767_22790 [Anaeromyxobacter sp.]